MPERELNAAELDIIKNKLKLDPAVVKGNVLDWYNRIGDMESDNNEQAANTESSAKGVYQYLNENKTNPKGEAALSSFQVGLNRTRKAFASAGADVPRWVVEAERHEDPRKLTREQADTLLLSDLYYRPAKTSQNMKDYFTYGQERAQALADLYGNQHHTDTDQNENVKRRMVERLGAHN